MSGMLAPETFCIFGSINNHRVTILVNDSRTHNFVQLRVAIFLHLPITTIDSFYVMVGNGGVLHCNHLCTQVSILIQGHLFKTNLFALSLSGADIVLGVQWLKELGPVLIYYTTLVMSFSYSRKQVHLKVDVPFGPVPVLAQ